jgi:hypothetical protein
MEIPNPSMLGVDLPFIIVEIPQENHLKQMIDKKLVNNAL